MESSKTNNLNQENQIYSNAISDNRSDASESQNRQNSNLEKLPTRKNFYSNFEHNSKRYENSYNNRVEDDDWDEKEKTTEGYDQIDDQDLDENGFPRSNDYASRFRI